MSPLFLPFLFLLLSLCHPHFFGKNNLSKPFKLLHFHILWLTLFLPYPLPFNTLLYIQFLLFHLTFSFGSLDILFNSLSFSFSQTLLGHLYRDFSKCFWSSVFCLLGVLVLLYSSCIFLCLSMFLVQLNLFCVPHPVQCSIPRLPLSVHVVLLSLFLLALNSCFWYNWICFVD